MSLQVWLPLNGNLNNQGLNDFNQIINTNPTYVNNGKIGKALSLGSISMPADTMQSIFKNNCFSICFWIYVNADTGDTAKRAMLFGNNSPRRYSLFQYPTCNDLHWSWANDTTNNVTGVYSNAFPSYKWTHCTITYDSITLKIYLNGELKHSANYTYTPVSLNYDTRLFENCANNARYLNDYRIYDHAISKKEVEEISKGLVLHYKLNRVNDNLAFNVLDLSKWSKESGVIVTWDNTVQMFKVQDTSHTSSRWGIYQQIDCLPNTTYTFSVDGMKVNNTSYIAADSSVSGAWPSNGSAFTTTRTRLFKTFTTGSDHTKIRMYLALYPTDGGTNYTYFANPKLEFGSNATDFIPENFNNNIIEDSSGYGNNGWLIDGKGINDSPRYKTSLYLKGTTIDNSSNTITGAQYFYGKLSLSASSALTISWWGNNITYGRGGIFETTAQIFDATNGYYGTDYNTTAIANWDSTFGIYNGSTRINIFSSFKKDSIWHYHAIVFDAVKVYYYCDGILITSSTLTGTLPSFNGIRMGLGRAGGVYRQIEQKVSDLRIYTTALTADQIKELYDTSATIDKNGNVYAREVIEK